MRLNWASAYLSLAALVAMSERSQAAERSAESRLEPYVQFLKAEGAAPQRFLLDALRSHQVLVLGEVHHRPVYWRLNADLVQLPEFAERAGVVYLELPANGQRLVDEGLARASWEPAPFVETLRDMLWMGWPDQSMLDFFKAVWSVNRRLPGSQRLRLVLTDVPRPWKEIRKRGDWARFETDRDEFMARTIREDLRLHAADVRHALFVVGYGHAMVNVARLDGEPVRTAGWHLRRELGPTNVCAVFPHSPVMANMGGVRGRLADGLFDSAFASLGNRPLAFPLDHGPFGQQRFDASLDVITRSSFKDGFDAYLYLGPLEEEVFSALIPGFYTEGFVQELERRSLLTFGQGLVEAHGVARSDAPSFVAWMSRTWGQPRKDWSVQQLGPLDAWSREAELVAPAVMDSQRMRSLVENFFQGNFRDISARDTLEWGPVVADSNGVCSITYKYRARIWDRKTVTNHQEFSFDARGKFIGVRNLR